MLVLLGQESAAVRQAGTDRYLVPAGLPRLLDAAALQPGRFQLRRRFHPLDLPEPIDPEGPLFSMFEGEGFAIPEAVRAHDAQRPEPQPARLAGRAVMGPNPDAFSRALHKPVQHRDPVIPPRHRQDQLVQHRLDFAPHLKGERLLDFVQGAPPFRVERRIGKLGHALERAQDRHRLQRTELQGRELIAIHQPVSSDRPARGVEGNPHLAQSLHVAQYRSLGYLELVGQRPGGLRPRLQGHHNGGQTVRTFHAGFLLPILAVFFSLLMSALYHGIGDSLHVTNKLNP